MYIYIYIYSTVSLYRIAFRMYVPGQARASELDISSLAVGEIHIPLARPHVLNLSYCLKTCY